MHEVMQQVPDLFYLTSYRNSVWPLFIFTWQPGLVVMWPVFFVISASASQSCRLTVTSTLNLVKRTKGRGRGSFRVSLYIRPNVSHNLPPFPVILASYGPHARPCHNCR